ncbi:MAG TPA: RuBisCO large subunit C-terminal-like domain-containing protein, partial [Sphingomonas sp.]|nr:RuBisCO large subunit C-terminal-like domain-containing protein [Sphingomonas sp.]
SPAIGMSYNAFQKLWRLAGIDHTHVNGIDNKFCETNESVIASARECLTPMFDPPHPGCEIMPVFSSGQSARQAAPTFAALGSVDCMFAAGGGILAHPGGPAAGVVALRQAWDAAVAGVPVDDAARDAPELAAALGAFGA